jgi:peptide/nickel transport system substrate-binding protein
MIKRRLLLQGAGIAGVAALIGACTPAAAPAPTAKPAAPAANTGAPAAPTAAPAAAATAAAPAKPAANAPVRGGSMVIAVAREAGELDVGKASIGTTRVYARALYNTLTNVDLKGNVIPELALSWSAPNDKTWEFKLRPNVKFHDGTNFDAAAVKFNMDRISDVATASLWRTELFPNVTEVAVVDPLTVRFTMREADVSLPARMSGKAGHIAGPDAIKKWGAEYGLHPVGTGPFELVDWTKDSRLNLKRFEGYWEKDENGVQLPYLDRLSYRPIPDGTVMFAGVRSGDVDLMEAILPSNLAQVKADPNLVAVEGPGTVQVFRFNVSKAPFDNKFLRQAINWAIDREAIHKGIYFSTGAPISFISRPGTWVNDPNAPTYNTRDLAKARAALAQGGQPNGFKFTGLANNGTIDQQFAQAIKAQLAEVNIDMTVQVLDAAAQAQRRTNGDYELGFSVSPPNPDPTGDFLPFQTDSAPNYSKYTNARVDELIAIGRSTTVQADRQKAYWEAQRILVDETPSGFLHLDADIKVMRSRVQGYSPTPDSYIGNVARLWVKG